MRVEVVDPDNLLKGAPSRMGLFHVERRINGIVTIADELLVAARLPRREGVNSNVQPKRISI